ncbi:cytochrome P450 [Sphingobium cloacae]|nr:cytochrome P450 [Sphingobium cloacae]
MQNRSNRPEFSVDFDHESLSHALNWPEEFKTLRSRCPLAWTESHGGYWVASRYQDIVDIAQNSGVFTSHKEFDPATGAVVGGLSIPPMPTPRGIPDETDPPEWGGFRSFLNRRFAPKAVESRRRRTEQLTTFLIDRVIEAGKFDIVDDLTNPLPALSTMDLFGLPLGEWREFADPLHRMMYTPKEHPDFLEAVKGWDWIRTRIEEEIEKRRTNPQDDLLSHLAHGEIDNKKLDRATIWSIALNVIIGGVDTTTALTANALMYLSECPDERRYLIENPDKLPVAREEFVRFFSPIHGLARNAAMDAEVQGRFIGQGERIYLAYASGNRDESIFHDADEINVRRFPRFRGQSLTGDSVADSRLAFGGSLGRADRRYGRRMGSDRAAAAA